MELCGPRSSGHHSICSIEWSSSLLIYVPAWLSASRATDDPGNDLLLLQRLLSYRNVDQQIAGAALPVLRRQLWHLRAPTVMFALFSDSVEDAVK